MKKKSIFVLVKIKPNMRIKYLLFFLLILPFYTLSAQTDPRYTLLPWLNPCINPGALGETELHINFTGVLRQQTIPGITIKKDSSDSRPSSKGDQVLLNIDSYIKQIKGAIGISFLKDNNSQQFDNIVVKLGYATRFKVRGGKLGIGVQMGFLNMTPGDNHDPFENPDPTVTNAKQSDSYLDFDMNFGIFYKAPTWYVGASATQLLGGVRISGDIGVLSPLARQLYFSGGYIWNLNTAVPWSIEPSAYIYTYLSNWTFDVMAVARYNGILWFGLSYQHNWAISALFGAVPFYNSTNNYLRGLELGLAYGFQINKMGYRSGGSWGDFELVARYGFNFWKEKALTGYGSSRHLYKNQY